MKAIEHVVVHLVDSYYFSKCNSSDMQRSTDSREKVELLLDNNVTDPQRKSMCMVSTNDRSSKDLSRVKRSKVVRYA